MTSSSPNIQIKSFEMKKNSSHFAYKQSSSSTSDYDSEREVYSDIDAFEEDLGSSQIKANKNNEQFERMKKLTCSMPALPDLDELDQ